MDHAGTHPDLPNLTQELERTHPRLWAVSIEKALKKEEMPSFIFYPLIVYLQAL